eukprot:3009838-Rhodomonas_salina.1
MSHSLADGRFSKRDLSRVQVCSVCIPSQHPFPSCCYEAGTASGCPELSAGWNPGCGSRDAASASGGAGIASSASGSAVRRAVRSAPRRAPGTGGGWRDM